MRLTRISNRRPLPKPAKSKLCYLCSKSADIPTREHVFARQLFAPDELEDPIILTACKSCNEEKALDEEYCYIKLILSDGERFARRQYDYFFETKVRQFVRKKVQGHNEKGMGLLAVHDKLFHEAYEKQKTKRLQQKDLQFPVDPDRFQRFYERIAKGLYTVASGKIQNWDDYTILCADESSIGSEYERILSKGWVHATHKEEWGKHLLAVGGTIEKTPSGNDWSSWTIMIYNMHGAGVIFMPKND